MTYTERNAHPLHPFQQTMEQQLHRACERTKSKQSQNQPRHIHIDHAFYCSI